MTLPLGRRYGSAVLVALLMLATSFSPVNGDGDVGAGGQRDAERRGGGGRGHREHGQAIAGHPRHPLVCLRC